MSSEIKNMTGRAEIFSFSFEPTMRLNVCFRVDDKAAAVALLAQLERFVLTVNEPSDAPAVQAKKESAPVVVANTAPSNGTPLTKQPETTRYQVDTIAGKVDVIAHASGMFTAKFGMFGCTEKTEAEAIEGALNKTPPVQARQEIVEPKPEEPKQAAAPVVTPVASPTVAVPNDVLAAQSFTQVLKYFKTQNILDADVIVAKCTEWKAAAPIFSRGTVDKERVQRGLTVLNQS